MSTPASCVNPCRLRRTLMRPWKAERIKLSTMRALLSLAVRLCVAHVLMLDYRLFTPALRNWSPRCHQQARLRTDFSQRRRNCNLAKFCFVGCGSLLRDRRASAEVCRGFRGACSRVATNRCPEKQRTQTLAQQTGSLCPWRAMDHVSGAPHFVKVNT